MLNDVHSLIESHENVPMNIFSVNDSFSLKEMKKNCRQTSITDVKKCLVFFDKLSLTQTSVTSVTHFFSLVP